MYVATYKCMYFTAPGVQHQVLVIAENNIGSGPAVIQEFYTKQLSKQLFIADRVSVITYTMTYKSICSLKNIQHK